MKIPNRSDIQDAIDAQILARGLGKYVDAVTYLPLDAPVPPEATHVLTLASADGDHKVQVAIKFRSFYGALANVALRAL